MRTSTYVALTLVSLCTTLIGCSGSDLIVGKGSPDNTSPAQTPDKPGSLQPPTRLSTACNFTAKASRAKTTGNCEDNGWCWEDPTPTGVATHVASAPGAAEPWTWSEHSLRQLSGKEWKAHSLPVNTPLTGAFVRSASDIWVSTEFKADAASDGYVYHYDGSKWSNAGAPTDKYGMLHGTADGGMWGAKATGVSYEQLGTFDGSKWTVLEQDAPSTRDMQILDYRPVSSHEVWVLRRSGLDHYLDGQWQTYAPPADSSFESLQVLPDGSVWAGGSAISNPDLGQLFLFDGQKFVQQPIPNCEGIEAINGNSATDMWLGSTFGAVNHFDGKGFSSTFTAALSIKDLAVVNAEVYAFAQADAYQIGATAHFDGRSWDDGATLLPRISSIWGSAYDDIWAFDAGGSRWHFDGSAWKVTETGTLDSVKLWGSDKDNVYSVSADGTIDHYDGQRWSKVVDSTEYEGNTPVHSSNSVSASSANDLWIAAGPLFHYDGKKLSQFSVDLKATSVQAFADDDIWVTTSSPDLLHFDGQQWSSLNIPATRVWGTSSSDLWVAQVVDSYIPAHYFATHFDGTTWTKHLPSHVPLGADYPPYNELLDDQSALGGCDNYFWMSLGGQVNIFDGKTWTTSLSEGPNIRAIWGLSPNSLLVGGDGGLLRKAP